MNCGTAENLSQAVVSRQRLMTVLMSTKWSWPSKIARFAANTKPCRSGFKSYRFMPSVSKASLPSASRLSCSRLATQLREFYLQTNGFSRQIGSTFATSCANLLVDAALPGSLSCKIPHRSTKSSIKCSSLPYVAAKTLLSAAPPSVTPSA